MIEDRIETFQVGHGYDVDAIREAIKKIGAEAVNAAKVSRRNSAPQDRAK